MYYLEAEGLAPPPVESPLVPCQIWLARPGDYRSIWGPASGEGGGSLGGVMVLAALESFFWRTSALVMPQRRTSGDKSSLCSR